MTEPDMRETRQEMLVLTRHTMLWMSIAASIGVWVFLVQLGWQLGRWPGAIIAAGPASYFTVQLIRIQIMMRNIVDPSPKWLAREAAKQEAAERAERERLAREVADLEKGLR